MFCHYSDHWAVVTGGLGQITMSNNKIWYQKGKITGGEKGRTGGDFQRAGGDFPHQLTC